jgi:hypothetical protein
MVKKTIEIEIKYTEHQKRADFVEDLRNLINQYSYCISEVIEIILNDYDTAENETSNKKG